MADAFLKKGNGHQAANRKKALGYVLDNFEGASLGHDGAVNFPPYGSCHFAAYTSEDGAMISSPNKADGQYGAVDWHHRDRIMMFRDFGDGRCMIYVSAIKPLFEARTIGHHGVKWMDVDKIAEFKKVFRP